MGEFDLYFKIILLGDCGVGKTTVVNKLSQKSDTVVGGCCCYSFTPNSSVELVFNRHGKKIRAKLIDTGGQERYRSMTTSYFRGADGCLLMFDVANVRSFESLHDWNGDLHKYSPSTRFTTLMVGIKSSEGGNEVPETRIEKMAENLELSYRRITLNNTDSITCAVEELIDAMVVKYRTGESISVQLSRESIEVGKEQDCPKFKCAC